MVGSPVFVTVRLSVTKREKGNWWDFSVTDILSFTIVGNFPTPTRIEEYKAAVNVFTTMY
jgi:hypothetical protein